MQLLRMLDDGQAVDISGLEDKNISGYLRELFRALRLHRSSEGLFLLPESSSQKIMEVLGQLFVIDSIALNTEGSMPQQEIKRDEDKDEYENAEQDSKKAGLHDRGSQVDEEIPYPKIRR